MGSTQDRLSERIAELQAGTDDFIIKPFDLYELIARIVAVARRYAGNHYSMVRIREIKVDILRKFTTRDRVAVTLTAQNPFRDAILDRSR